MSEDELGLGLGAAVRREVGGRVEGVRKCVLLSGLAVYVLCIFFVYQHMVFVGWSLSCCLVNFDFSTNGGCSRDCGPAQRLQKGVAGEMVL